MKSIYDVDKNFFVASEIGKPDVTFYNIQAQPFQVYGVFYREENSADFRSLLLQPPAALSTHSMQTLPEVVSVSAQTVPM